MLRRGRWDELFFVDLPNQQEREAIWEIQITKHGRDPKDFDVVQLGRVTDGLTGSEIESVFIEPFIWHSILGAKQGRRKNQLTSISPGC